MTNAKNTKRALLMSVLSMMLCMAMLVGSTFAWFTDSVTSGKNRIVAGNLDVELYYKNASTSEFENASEASVADPNFFVDKDGKAVLWEPGVMAVTQFKVVNEGSLALKYSLATLKAGFNAMAGHDLSEVIKFAVIDNDQYTADTTRESILALNPKFDDFTGFTAEGHLLPADKATADEPSEKIFTVVAYWAPNANDVDNLYNVNNGQKTDDNADQLYIDIEIRLNATQYTYEQDSFDEKYDENAEYPAVKVSSADELIDALKAGGNIILDKDITVAEQLVVDSEKSVQLDLAGKTLSSSFGGWTIVNYGVLTIDDSTGKGVVCNTSKEAGDSTHFILRNHGTMIVNGGTFGDVDTDRTNANSDNWGAAVMNVEGSTTINGGYFTCGDNYWTGSPAGASFSYAIRNYGGTMTINGGTVYGKMNGGIAASNGEIIINGGEFSVDGGYYVLVTGNGTITVNDGVFSKTGNDRLIGGYNGMPSWDASADLEGNGYTINGGTFTVDGQTVTLPPVDEGNFEDQF